MVPRATVLGVPGSCHPAQLDPLRLLASPLPAEHGGRVRPCSCPGHEGEALVGLGRPLASGPPCTGGLGLFRAEGAHLQPWLLAPGGGDSMSPPHGFPQKQPLVTGRREGRGVAPVPRSLPWRWACSVVPSMAALRELPHGRPGLPGADVLLTPSPWHLSPPQGWVRGEAGCHDAGPRPPWPPTPRQQKCEDSLTHLSRDWKKKSQEKERRKEGKRQR